MSKGMTEKQKRLFAKLTAMQKEICTALAAGASERDAYRSGRGKATKNGPIDAYMSRMRKIKKVAEFLDSMNVEIFKKSIMTREKALERLTEIAEGSKTDTASISAIGKLCEMQGWNAPSKTMEVPAPPGISERYNQEDYEAAEQKFNDRFGS